MLRIEISFGGIVIAINILTQKSNLFNSLLIQPFNFPQNGIQISTPFSASHPRHDTEWAHIVTSPHDRKVGADIIWVLADRCNIRIGLLHT